MACRRSGRRDLARAVKRAGAILEGADDARHGLAEDDADDLAKDGVAELEIDEEIDLAAAMRQVGKAPAAFEIFERPVQIFGVDAPVSGPERHPAAEALAKDLEADDQIGLDQLAAIGLGAARADAGGGVPGQKLGVSSISATSAYIWSAV